QVYGGKITFCEPKVSSRKEVCDRVQEETGAYLVHPYDDDRIIAGQATAAKEMQEETGAYLVHPYDDDRIIAGQATAAKEFLEEMPDLDAVFAPVSGGGLLSGTCLGAKGLRKEIRIIGCEPARADDAYRSLTSGTLQSLQ